MTEETKKVSNKKKGKVLAYILGIAMVVFAVICMTQYQTIKDLRAEVADCKEQIDDLKVNGKKLPKDWDSKEKKAMNMRELGKRAAATCPGGKLRSDGMGRGLGTGEGQGPLRRKKKKKRVCPSKATLSGRPYGVEYKPIGLTAPAEAGTAGGGKMAALGKLAADVRPAVRLG